MQEEAKRSWYVMCNFSNTSEIIEGSLFLNCRVEHEPSRNVWLIDSSNNHMTNDKSLVAYLDQLVRTKVKLVTNMIVSVVRKGVVNILIKHDQQRSIADALQAPSFKHYLINIGHLTHKIYNIVFKGEECCICEKPPRKQLIVKVQMTQNMIYLNFMNCWKRVSSSVQRVPQLVQINFVMAFQNSDISTSLF